MFYMKLFYPTLPHQYYPPHTVTRPYAGFRHPDRMAPDQTVRGGENDCFIWSGNFLAQVPKFSSIFRNPGILLRFTWSLVRRVPFLCWYFTFIGAGRHFRNFPEIYPVKKWKSAHGGIQQTILGILLHASTSTPQIPYRKIHKINTFFFIYSTSCTHNKRMSEFAIKNKQ